MKNGMPLFQKILACLIVFLFICVIYSAAIQIPWSNKESLQAAIIGNIVLGTLTLCGAALVIIAARIQAQAMDRQLTDNHKKENDTLLRRYIGWLEVIINTHSGLYAANRTKAYHLLTWQMNAPVLNNVPDIKNWVSGFAPQRPLADSSVYDLRALIPFNVAAFIAAGSEAVADIEQILMTIRICFESRAANIPHPMKLSWDDDIKKQIQDMGDAYEKLIQSYRDGLPAARTHLGDKIKEAASRSVI